MNGIKCNETDDSKYQSVEEFDKLVVELPQRTSNEKNLNEESSFVYKEGGWGWLVVISTGYCFGILVGMINNYALIYNELDRVYTGTKNHVVYAAWIGSVSTGVQYFFCSIGSFLTDFYGPRKIGLVGGIISTVMLGLSSLVKNLKLYFLTYGIGFGIGQAMLLTATFAILPHYFNKRLSLANGIMNFIAAIIVVLLPIFTSFIIEHHGLVKTFYFLTAISLVTVLMTLSYRPLLPIEENQKSIEKIKSSAGLEIFKKKKFLIWCIASFFAMFGYLIPVVNIDHHSIKTFPDKNPVWINIIFGASSGVGAIVFGKLGDLSKFNRVHYHTLVFLIYGLVQLTIPFATSFTVLLIQLAILGLMDGVLLCFIVPISYDLSKSSKLANHAAGYYHVIISLPSIAGPAVAGKIFEDFNRYDIGFYLGAISCLIGAFIQIVFILFIDLDKKKKKNKKLKVRVDSKL